MSEPAPTTPRIRLKRGRPRAEEVAQLEQAVLATSLELFLEGGVEAVSMERVAATAGISRTTLYKRYATSEALVDAMVQNTIESWYAETPAIPEAAGDDIEALLKHRLSAIARLLVDPTFAAFQRLLLGNFGRFPHLARTMHEFGYRDAVRLLANDIEHAASKRGETVTSAEMVAEQFITSIHGWYIQHALLRTLRAEEIEAYGAKVVGLLLAAKDRW